VTSIEIRWRKNRQRCNWSLDVKAKNSKNTQGQWRMSLLKSGSHVACKFSIPTRSQGQTCTRRRIVRILWLSGGIRDIFVGLHCKSQRQVHKCNQLLTSGGHSLTSVKQWGFTDHHPPPQCRNHRT